MGEKYVPLEDLVKEVAAEAAAYRSQTSDAGPLRRAWARATTTGDFLVRREAQNTQVHFDEERDVSYPNYGPIGHPDFAKNAAPELTVLGRAVETVVDVFQTGQVADVNSHNYLLEINKAARKYPDSITRISPREK